MVKKEELLERVQIFKEAKMISSDVEELCLQSIDLLEREQFAFDEERTSIFITHLAMASQRVVDGSAEMECNQEMISLLEKEPAYERGIQMLQKILGSTTIVFPDSEIGFLKIHLCNLFSI